MRRALRWLLGLMGAGALFLAVWSGRPYIVRFIRWMETSPRSAIWVPVTLAAALLLFPWGLWRAHRRPRVRRGKRHARTLPAWQALAFRLARAPRSPEARAHLRRRMEKLIFQALVLEGGLSSEGVRAAMERRFKGALDAIENAKRRDTVYRAILSILEEVGNTVGGERRHR